jgi:hypothetical protein
VLALKSSKPIAGDDAWGNLPALPRKPTGRPAASSCLDIVKMTWLTAVLNSRSPESSLREVVPAMHFSDIVTNYANELMRLHNIASTDVRLRNIPSQVDRNNIASNYFLSLSDAIKLRDNYIFLGEPTASPAKWVIFFNWNTYKHADTAPTQYQLCGTIDCDLPTDSFVSLAYQYILGREPDPDGAQNYRTRMETSEFSEYDVLHALLLSDEAQNKRIHIIVVPQPSPWLADLPSTLSIENLASRA